MPTRTSPAFTQRHYQDLAALLAAERDQNGPSPALNRITAAITRLLADDNPSFNRELFGKAARGRVSPASRPRRHSDRSDGTAHAADAALRTAMRRRSPGRPELPDRGWTP